MAYAVFLAWGIYQIGFARTGSWSSQEAGLVSSYFALQATRARMQAEAIAEEVLRPVLQHY